MDSHGITMKSLNTSWKAFDPGLAHRKQQTQRSRPVSTVPRSLIRPCPTSRCLRPVPPGANPSSRRGRVLRQKGSKTIPTRLGLLAHLRFGSVGQGWVPRGVEYHRTEMGQEPQTRSPHFRTPRSRFEGDGSTSGHV